MSQQPRRSRPSHPSLAWTDKAQRTHTALTVTSGIPVIAVTGHLDRAALPPCREAMDAALAMRPTRVVIDLWRVSDADDTAVALLAAMRRAAHWHGVAMSLAAVPTGVLRRIEQAKATDLFDVQPTSSAAVKATLAQPRAMRTPQVRDRLGSLR
jgi:anti-anti-sigma factor